MKSVGAEWLGQHLGTLKSVMSAPFEWFGQFGETYATHVMDGGQLVESNRHIHIDRGAKVLGVAHLDSVKSYRGLTLSNATLRCATIDNRLGAWLMLYGLPSLGVEIDVLLTENEEWGMSTAQDFETDKEYHWAFSFDRSGDDVACYQFYDGELKQMLAEYGLKAAYGSYSDVVELNLGVKAMNFGCGMYNYHNDNAYASLDELVYVVERFLDFYSDKQEEKLPHTHTPITRHSSWVRDDYGERYYAGNKPWYYEDETTAPIVWRSGKKWDIVDSYHGRSALDRPSEFLDGCEYPDEWHHHHSLGDINRTEVDEEIMHLYFDGGIVLCQECENLFARMDVDHYLSLERSLCKSCFFQAALAQGLNEE